MPSIRSTTGETVSFTSRLRVGRAEGNDLRIDLDTVSGDHAVLEVRGGELQVRDLGSTNGTRVRGRRILGWTRLRPGEPVRFGPDSEWEVRAVEQRDGPVSTLAQLQVVASRLSYPVGEDRFVIGSSAVADLCIEGLAEVEAVIVLEDGVRSLIPMATDAPPFELEGGIQFTLGGSQLRFIDDSGGHLTSTVPERTRSRSYDLSLRLIHDRPGDGTIEITCSGGLVSFAGVPNRFVLLLVLARVALGLDKGLGAGWVDDERLRVALWGRAGATARYNSALGKVIYDTRRMIAAKGVDPFFIEKSKGRTRLRLEPDRVVLQGE